jgi:hypothetical protein
MQTVFAETGEGASEDQISSTERNRIVSCAGCGAVLGIYIEGGRVPESDHDCTV